MAIMCKCVEISLLGCVEQSVVQIVPSLTRFLPMKDPALGRYAQKENIFLKMAFVSMELLQKQKFKCFFPI